MKLYPGMKLVQDSLITTSTADGQSANANYTTSDPVEKVVQFYQKELGEAAKLEKTQENGATIAILILTEGSTVRTVTVSRNQGEEVTTVSLTKNVRSAPKG